MKPRRLLRLLSDFDGKIRYHPRKASVAAGALSRNERAKPLKLRALVMTINSNLPPQIHEARVETLKKENVKDENLHGMDKEFENRLDGTLCIRRRSWLLRIRDLGELNYAGMRRKHLEFQIGGKGKLKALPWEGVIRFSKRGKLNPGYIRSFKILAKVGMLAYRLELPEQLSQVHSTFHVSNLRKCFVDEPPAIPLDEIQIDDKLNFIKEPVKIMDR
ncbi:hypothetical protein Tco_0327062 [Tanacetum coccineum]